MSRLVFLASHAIEPEYSFAFQELRCEIEEDLFKRHKARLGRWSRRGIAPADATAARLALLALVDKATQRLQVLEDQRKQVAGKIGELRADILSFDESKTGKELRRHLGSCNRLMLRNVDAVGKLHRNEAQGWGRARKERERKKTEKGAAQSARRAIGSGRRGERLHRRGLQRGYRRRVGAIRRSERVRDAQSAAFSRKMSS